MSALFRHFCVAALGASALSVAHGQSMAPGSDPVAVHWVQRAVDAQLASDRDDHSRWMYLDHDTRPDGHDTVDQVVESRDGDLHRCVQRNGKPLNPTETQDETNRLNEAKHDLAGQAKTRRASQKDDQEASNMLRNFPGAFVWTIASETPQQITLDYRPYPKFSAPTMASKVMAQMTGQMVVDKKGGHIYTMKGHLTQDVTLLFGLVKLKSGGWFDVQRREVGPGHWQIVEQRTHMDGRALLFKTVGQQEDEIKYDFKPSPAGSLMEAGKVLGADR